jgi:hypothetical protein
MEYEGENRNELRNHLASRMRNEMWGLHFDPVGRSRSNSLDFKQGASHCYFATDPKTLNA